MLHTQEVGECYILIGECYILIGVLYFNWGVLYFNWECYILIAVSREPGPAHRMDALKSRNRLGKLFATGTGYVTFDLRTWKKIDLKFHVKILETAVVRRNRHEEGPEG